jgi:hypothetical protein
VLISCSPKSPQDPEVPVTGYATATNSQFSIKFFSQPEASSVRITQSLSVSEDSVEIVKIPPFSGSLSRHESKLAPSWEMHRLFVLLFPMLMLR